MSSIEERLKRGVAVLEELQQKRLETHDRKRGYDTEHQIIETELLELEDEIVRNPGALASQLVHVTVRSPAASRRSWRAPKRQPDNRER